MRHLGVSGRSAHFYPVDSELSNGYLICTGCGTIETVPTPGQVQELREHILKPAATRVSITSSRFMVCARFARRYFRIKRLFSSKASGSWCAPQWLWMGKPLGFQRLSFRRFIGGFGIEQGEFHRASLAGLHVFSNDSRSDSKSSRFCSRIAFVRAVGAASAPLTRRGRAATKMGWERFLPRSCFTFPKNNVARNVTKGKQLPHRAGKQVGGIPLGPERREALIELASCGPMDHDDKLIVLVCCCFKFLISQVPECS